MQARQTKNSSMILNLSFCPFCDVTLFKATPFGDTRDVIMADGVTTSFFRFPDLCGFLLDDLRPDLENREMLIPCGGFCPRRRVLIKVSQPVKWSGRLQPPKAALAPLMFDWKREVESVSRIKINKAR